MGTPLATTTAPVFSLRAAAAESLSAMTSAAVIPSRRASSPTCGVSTALQFAFLIISMLSAMQFRPSASRMRGIFFSPQKLIIPRTSSLASSQQERPLPMAMTVIFSAAEHSFVSSPEDMAPLSFAERVQKVASYIPAAARSITAGTEASFTSPAPLLRAALRFMAAAPLIFSEPAIISSLPKVPLWQLCPLSGTHFSAITSVIITGAPVFSKQLSVMPISRTIILPQFICAGKRVMPILGAPNVTVRAHMGVPADTLPVTLSAPEGISAARIKLSFDILENRLIISAESSPWKPVPKTASTTASYLSDIRSSSVSRNVILLWAIFAYSSSAIPLLGAPQGSVTKTRAPISAMRRAITKPSPPLLPLPHNMSTRLSAFISTHLQSSWTAAVPAFSISPM